MLKINVSPEFTNTVKVTTKALQGEFPCYYRVLPVEELDKLDDGKPNSWRLLLAKVVVKFEPIEIGGEVVSTLEQLIRWPGVGPAMLAAYWSGLYEAAQGN